MFSTRAVRSGVIALAVTCAALASSPAFAQAPAAVSNPNAGKLTLTISTDALNTYMFRGIRQNSTGVDVWPAADLGLAAYSGDGALKTVSVNFGTWNSLHSGDTGADTDKTGLGCRCGKMWYESDFYTTVGLGFGGGASVGTTYTAYTSPNNGFTTVKEIAFKIAEDDSAFLGMAAIKPYAVFAFELDTAPGVGQADGGLKAGRYLELGAAPGYSFPKATLTVPVKVGLSMSNYYEHPVTGVDNKFGFFSLAGLVTVPLGSKTAYGQFNVHGGAEWQRLGDTTKLFAGKDNLGIYSFGFGWTY